MQSIYLKQIITSNNSNRLDELFLKLYEDIYREFVMQYKLDTTLKLRLLPISTGIFINNNIDYKIKIFKSLIRIYIILNEKYNITPVIYINDINDYNIFASIVVNTQY